MKTAVDTSILLDLLIPGAPSALTSKQLLDDAIAEGTLIISEVVFAELAATFKDLKRLQLFLQDTGIWLEPSGPETLAAAGAAWARYTKARPKSGAECNLCGKRLNVTCSDCGNAVQWKQHLMADFMIGAHAQTLASKLLSRDTGYYRNYLPGLTVVGPPSKRSDATDAARGA